LTASDKQIVFESRGNISNSLPQVGLLELSYPSQSAPSIHEKSGFIKALRSTVNEK
jgi:hypothetical protein